jgi:membrane protease YdiL (CAAX protease family)
MKNSIAGFLLLVVVLSIPFYLIGAVTGLTLLPGLPMSALAAFCPMIAAIILTHRESGIPGVVSLLKRSYDFRRIKSRVWYVPLLLLMPAVMMLSFAVVRLSGVPVPTPQVEVLPALALLVAFFVAAVGEELGWCGYAIDPMQAKWGALQAAIILGVFWVVWHYPPLIQADRSAAWIAWWSLGSIALRVIIVWLYNNGKSVFAASLFHMTINLTWQLFPTNGSYYDPFITSVIIVGVAAVMVTVRRIQMLKS